MTYKRRYLSGQEAVTVDIAEQAVTSDKIASGAVDNEELAPDSVTTEKIRDQAVQTQDIKDAAVTAPKIADQAVETEKIKDGAVTSDKLDPSSSIVTRPVSPGIATEEIADEAVTPAKLAADAVETDKIKDGAVSTPKIAHDAITEDKIADDAVESEHIEAGAVTNEKLDTDSVSENKMVDASITHDKIGVGAVYGDRIADNGVDTDQIADGAVETDQIANEAVSGDKLAIAALQSKHISSKRVRLVDLYDDFVGAGISNKWVFEGDAGSGIYTRQDTGLRMILSAGGNISARLYAPYVPDVVAGVDQVIDFRLAVSGALTFVDHFLGLYKDADNYIAFRASNPGGAGAGRWYAVCRVGGVETAEDTGLDVETGESVLSIEITGNTSVKFYIDGILKATITTNIPTDYEPVLQAKIEGAAGALKHWDFRYISLLATRPAYA